MAETQKPQSSGCEGASERHPVLEHVDLHAEIFQYLSLKDLIPLAGCKRSLRGVVRDYAAKQVKQRLQSYLPGPHPEVVEKFLAELDRRRSIVGGFVAHSLAYEAFGSYSQYAILHVMAPASGASSWSDYLKNMGFKEVHETEGGFFWDPFLCTQTLKHPTAKGTISIQQCRTEDVLPGLLSAYSPNMTVGMSSQALFSLYPCISARNVKVEGPGHFAQALARRRIHEHSVEDGNIHCCSNHYCCPALWRVSTDEGVAVFQWEGMEGSKSPVKGVFRWTLGRDCLDVRCKRYGLSYILN